LFPLRPATEADAEQIAALFRAVYPRWRPVAAGDVLAWLDDPDVGEQNIRVLELGGRVVGYGDITPGKRDVQLDVAAPGHWEVFLDWLEERARGSRARTYFPQGHELETVVRARGYRFWRSSFTMEIDLPSRPPAPRVPAGIEVRPYREEDAGAVIAAMNEAFVEDPFWHRVDPESFRTVYAGSRHGRAALWRVAWVGEEVAGCVLPDPSRGADTSLGWVRILAVRAPWRRRGLGEALLRVALRDHYDRGLRRAGLGVDAENPTGAVALYERVGMRTVYRLDNWVKDMT
jgi:ribosomal protein S18 acetylase RimI-like enzyme